MSEIDITAWIERVLNGGGGLKAYRRGVPASKQVIAGWIIKCLANPRCEGAAEVLEAINEQRVRARCKALEEKK